MKKLVILISGNGSNLQALIDSCNSGAIPARVCAVISNRPNAYGLVRAAQQAIPTHVITLQEFPDRTAYDQALTQVVARLQPDLIALAGFMHILGQPFIKRFAGQILNIHPSLLPKYPGLNTHQRVLQQRESLHGATVHWVTETLDGGPIVLQGCFPLSPQMDLPAVIQQVKQLEHQIYPLAVRWFIEGRLQKAQNAQLACPV